MKSEMQILRFYLGRQNYPLLTWTVSFYFPVLFICQSRSTFWQFVQTNIVLKTLGSNTFCRKQLNFVFAFCLSILRQHGEIPRKDYIFLYASSCFLAYYSRNWSRYTPNNYKDDVIINLFNLHHDNYDPKELKAIFKAGVYFLWRVLIA